MEPRPTKGQPTLSIIPDFIPDFIPDDMRVEVAGQRYAELLRRMATSREKVASILDRHPAEVIAEDVSEIIEGFKDEMAALASLD